MHELTRPQTNLINGAHVVILGPYKEGGKDGFLYIGLNEGDALYFKGGLFNWNGFYNNQPSGQHSNPNKSGTSSTSTHGYFVAKYDCGLSTQACFKLTPYP